MTLRAQCSAKCSFYFSNLGKDNFCIPQRAGFAFPRTLRSCAGCGRRQGFVAHTQQVFNSEPFAFRKRYERRCVLSRYSLPRRYRSSGSGKSDPLVKLWALSIIGMIAGYVYLVSCGQFWETWLVSSRSIPLYFVLASVFGFGLYWWKTRPEFSNGELIFYSVVCLLCVYPAVSLGYLFLTELHDIEVWNGEAKEAEWTERYYEESTDSDGNTDTDYYGPYYKVRTSNDEEVDLTASEYRDYVSHWGGQSRVVSRRNSSADGEALTGCDHDLVAEIHTITWDGKEESRVSTSVEHVYANYLKASDSVLKIQGAMSGYENLLRDYPRVHGGRFGEVYFDRVVEMGTQVPANFGSTLDRRLDEVLRTLSSRKQCNIVVYVAATDREGLFSALQELWKKNDIAVCIGYTDQRIRWCRVMAWTDNKLFIEELQRSVRDLKSLEGKAEELADIIVDQINAPGASGYLRKPMADFEYLASQVRMPWWAQALVILAACVGVSPTLLLVLRD